MIIDNLRTPTGDYYYKKYPNHDVPNQYEISNKITDIIQEINVIIENINLVQSQNLLLLKRIEALELDKLQLKKLKS